MIVRVPASSANLGPGFDCFGLAWQLYNEISLDPADELRIEGCDPRWQGEDNLVYTAYRAALAACGKAGGTLHIRFRSTEIPVSRGLGSSAALITVGVLAANELKGLGLDRSGLLDLAAAIEGHPDNVAPALYGGLTLSLTDGSHALTRVFPVSEALRFTLLIPPFELSTALARSVLPRELPLADAVFNLSRAALLPRALAEGDGELLRLTLADRLHQPYRAGLIPGWETAEALAASLGALGLCLSGAGPTLLCISDCADAAFPAALAQAASEKLPHWRIAEACPDREGAQIIA